MTPSTVLTSPAVLPVGGANGERAPVPWTSWIGVTASGPSTVKVKVTSSVAVDASVTVAVIGKAPVSVGVPLT